jgi:hypothetical protein
MTLRRMTMYRMTLSRMTLSRMTQKIMTLCRMTQKIMTLSIMTQKIMTLFRRMDNRLAQSIMHNHTERDAAKHNDNEHNDR